MAIERRPVLALDSSVGGGSVAVGQGGRARVDHAIPGGRGASSLLLPAVDAAVRGAGLAPDGLGAIAVGGGPGSFTGLRIAAATAKALARSLDLPLFAFSGLLATAALHRAAGRPVCALFDARNREVFAGCWRFEGDAVAALLPPTATAVAEVLTALAGEAPLFTGDGAALHRAEIEAAFGAGSVAEDGDGSPAAGLLWLAHAVPELGRVADPAAWEPDYLRASGAERIAAAREG
ncbi:MAG TPA: tRNA (adenosine(37)-N6)-threonylcarbamoyltransferase complex dimerization subunit type 1 TsaB [Longimicrobium sp.]|nr:tRNA (adenosine(37)-N6)-threonylcarbamoyltransferase complex dimerization subunit type 1 TsaB [Longimicrobium sp.]